MQIKKIVSGGQTGADRAGLDFAIEYDIDHGGWVPEGRLAEDGPVSLRYNPRELAGGNYRRRTEKNVEDSFDENHEQMLSHEVRFPQSVEEAYDAYCFLSTGFSIFPVGLRGTLSNIILRGLL